MAISVKTVQGISLLKEVLPQTLPFKLVENTGLQISERKGPRCSASFQCVHWQHCCLKGVFKSITANLWINTLKLKRFPNPSDIKQFRNTKDFLLYAVCYKEWACQLLKFSMSQEVKKRAFCSFNYWELSKRFLTYFQKLMRFYLLTTKYSWMGKVWGKTSFRREMLWTALTEIAT